MLDMSSNKTDRLKRAGIVAYGMARNWTMRSGVTRPVNFPRVGWSNVNVEDSVVIVDKLSGENKFDIRINKVGGMERSHDELLNVFDHRILILEALLGY